MKDVNLPTDLLARIEEAGLNASAPPQQRLLDGWLVRFSAGKAKRARCINAISPGRLPLPHKLELCEQVYREAGLPMIVRITPFAQPLELDDHLRGMGLRRFDDTRVMVLDDLRGVAVPALADGLVLQWVALEPFAQTVGALRGSPLAQRQAHGLRLANAPVPFFAYVLKRGADVLACGQYALEGDLVGIYDVFTVPAARGQGWASLLCRHLLAQAQERGARHAYLQVEGDNHPARAVYHRLGFADAYSYHYRTRDPEAA